MNLFTKKKSTMKKRPSFVSTKQKIVATFTVTMMLLQICLPTAVWAASLLSNESIATAMSSQAFRKSSSNAYLYEQASFDDASYVGSQNIKSFRERLVANKINLGKPTFVPISSDITIFIPTYPTGKLIGDAYVQNRYIRQQVFDLLGRHLIYAADKNTSDVTQINTLYENAFIFAKAHPSINFGANLDSTIRDEISKDTGIDMIWPEVRIINNESVVVPVVYLKTTTINDNKVTKTITEFVGSAVTLGSITLDHAVLTLGANTMLKTKNNITLSKDSLIASGGDVNLVVGGTLNLIGSKITGTKDVNIIAKEVNVKAVVVPFQDRYGSGTKLGSVSSVNATTGNISIRSTGGDITFEASTATASNGSITLNSAANISIQPVFLSYQGDLSYGAWIINKSSVNIVGSKLSSRDTISLYAAGAITITSSELISTQGGIELLAQQGIYVLDEQGNTQINRQKIKGRTQGTSSDFNTWAVRSVLNAGKGVLMDTTDGDIILRAAKVSSTEGTGVYARNGKVHLLITKEQSQHYLNMVKKGTWTIKTHTVEQNNETAVPNSIVGGLAVEALQGVNVEYTGLVGADGKPIENLDDQMDAYKNMPELKWMSDLRNDPKVYAEWNKIKLIKINKDDTTRQLSPAAMAIIAIAVAVATGGASLSGQSFLTAAMNAGFTTLEVQAASSLLAGNSLEQTLKNMSSDESLKSLAISMVTAGAMNSVSNVNMELFKGDSIAASLGNQGIQAVVKSTVTAGVSVTINGGNTDDFKKAFKQSLATDAINTLGQNLTNKITNSTTLSEASKYIANATMGCLTAGLSTKLSDADFKNACVSAAGGAVIAQGLADALDTYTKDFAQKMADDLSSSNVDYVGPKLDFLRSNGADISKLVAAFAAFSLGGDVNAAASSAETVAKSNIARAASLMQIYLQITGDRDHGNVTSFVGKRAIEHEYAAYQDLKNKNWGTETEIQAFIKKQRDAGLFLKAAQIDDEYWAAGKNIDALVSYQTNSNTSQDDHKVGYDGEIEEVLVLGDKTKNFTQKVASLTGATERFKNSLTERERMALGFTTSVIMGGPVKAAINKGFEAGINLFMPQSVAESLGAVDNFYTKYVGGAGTAWLLGEDYSGVVNSYEAQSDSEIVDDINGIIWISQQITGLPGKKGSNSSSIKNVGSNESRITSDSRSKDIPSSNIILKNADGLSEVKAGQYSSEAYKRLNTPDSASGKEKYKPAEAAVGAQLESSLGEMKRYEITAGDVGKKTPDFEIVSGPNKGKKVDAMYTTVNGTQKEIDDINKYFAQQMTEQPKWGGLPDGQVSILEHIDKADFVPIDFKVLNTANQNIFLNYVKTLTPEQKAKILIVR